MAGLEDLYKEIIIDHYRNPRNRGELDSPPAHKTEGFNPLCGDEVLLTFALKGEIIEELLISFGLLGKDRILPFSDREKIPGIFKFGAKVEDSFS